MSKTKTTRHQYGNYEEMFHNFVHCNELVYHKGCSWDLIGKGNYLFYNKVRYCQNGPINPILTKSAKEFNEEMRYFNTMNVCAIINRKAKRAYIRQSSFKYCYLLRRAIPDDYTIIESGIELHDDRYLSDINKFHEITVKSLVEHIQYILLNIVSSITYNSSNVLNCTSNIIPNPFSQKYTEMEMEEYITQIHRRSYNFDYGTIKYYVDKYNLINKRWMNDKIPFMSKFTYKDLFTDKIFTEEEKLLIQQRWFYSRYCFQYGIPFSHIKDTWNKKAIRISSRMKDDKEYIKYQVYKDKTVESFEDFDTYQQVIAYWRKYTDKVTDDYFNENRKKSNENYKNAIKEVEDKLPKLIKAWRNNQGSNISVTYKEFTYHRGGRYEWEDHKIPVSISMLDNIYFKLSSDKTYIMTSRHAQIPLEDGIRLYKLFKDCRFTIHFKRYIDFRKDNSKFGLYQLSMMKYDEKKDDYCIIVGCHHMWIKDFEEFIHYYKLEEQFGLTN